MSVTVALSDGAPDLARVPLGAVFDAGKGPRVWVVDKATGAVTETPVVVALSDADSAYLSSRRAGGREIIALGVHKIDPHEKVRAIDNSRGALAMDRFNLSRWGLRHPQLVALPDLHHRGRRRGRLYEARPRGGPFVHDQERRSSRPNGQARPAPRCRARSPIRSSASCRSFPTPTRSRPIEARLHVDLVPVPRHDAAARRAEAVPAAAQEDGRREGGPARRRARPERQ